MSIRQGHQATGEMLALQAAATEHLNVIRQGLIGVKLAAQPRIKDQTFTAWAHRRRMQTGGINMMQRQVIYFSLIWLVMAFASPQRKRLVQDNHSDTTGVGEMLADETVCVLVGAVPPSMVWANQINRRIPRCFPLLGRRKSVAVVKTFVLRLSRNVLPSIFARPK
jgi:hypothetical protein